MWCFLPRAMAGEVGEQGLARLPYFSGRKLQVFSSFWEHPWGCWTPWRVAHPLIGCGSGRAWRSWRQEWQSWKESQRAARSVVTREDIGSWVPGRLGQSQHWQKSPCLLWLGLA